MQHLGQHFLINKSAIQKIVDSLEIKNGDVIVEIGSGHGELTDELLKVTSDVRQGGEGIKIIAIEKDPELAAGLKNKFAGNNNIEIIEGDARILLPTLNSPPKARLAKGGKFHIPNSGYKLVGNIPYYLTGFLFRIISEMENKPSVCVFTIQKEVAERMVAQPPRMNRLAASVQFWANPKIIQTIPARDFRPTPKVDSAIIRLEYRIWNLEFGKTPKNNRNTSDENPKIDPESYYSMIRTLYKQPRKTILNNLSTAGLPPKETVLEILQKLDILPGDRPQNLSVENIIDIAQLLQTR